MGCRAVISVGNVLRGRGGGGGGVVDRKTRQNDKTAKKRRLPTFCRACGRRPSGLAAKEMEGGISSDSDPLEKFRLILLCPNELRFRLVPMAPSAPLSPSSSKICLSESSNFTTGAAPENLL